MILQQALLLGAAGFAIGYVVSARTSQVFPAPWSSSATLSEFLPVSVSI